MVSYRSPRYSLNSTGIDLMSGRRSQEIASIAGVFESYEPFVVSYTKRESPKVKHPKNVYL